jgi:hypothetical protein
MTPEQLMEIPGIGEKMVDKIYQAVNRFYEGGGEAAAAPAEGADTTDEVVEGEETPASEETSANDAAAETTEAEAVPGADAQESDSTEAVPAEPAAEAAPEETPVDSAAGTNDTQQADPDHHDTKEHSQP